MIKFMKNERYIRLGASVLVILLLSVLFILLINKPNNETILKNTYNTVALEHLSRETGTLNPPLFADEQITPIAIFSPTEDTTKTSPKFPSVNGSNQSAENESQYPTENLSEHSESSDSKQNESVDSQKGTETPTQSLKDLIDFTAKYPFQIVINRAENFAVAYGIDKDRHYSIPYKSFVCSTGKNPEDTPLGVFNISDKYRWRLMVDGTYAQYAMRINGEIMLHSVPYLSTSNDTLEYWEYNKLGKAASLGCIRFNAKSIKWIYDHCPSGAIVYVYDKPGEKPPIPLKKFKKIKKTSKYSGWDPTDTDKNNPWKKAK